MSKESEIDERLDALEDCVEEIQEKCRMMLQRKDYVGLVEMVETLQLLVLGEDLVGAKPLRVMVDEIYAAYTEFRLTMKQLKTLLGFFGVTTIAGIVAFVALLLKVLELIKEFP